MFKKLLCALIACKAMLMGEWSSPLIIDQEFIALTPSLAINSKGQAILVYSKKNKKKFTAIAKTKAPNSKWSKPFSLVKNGTRVIYPEVTINSNGNAVAFWNYHPENDDRHLIQTYVLALGAKNWLPTNELTPTFIKNDPLAQLSLDEEGNTYAVWINGNSIESAFLEKLSTMWQPITPLKLGYPSIFQDQSLIVDNLGKAWALWTKGEDYYVGENVVVSPLSEKEGWNTPQVLAPEGKYYMFTTIACDSVGNLLTSWQLLDPNKSVIKRYDAMKHVWETTNFKQPLKGSGSLSITFDPAGNALCVYRDGNNLFSSTLPSGSLEWSEPICVTTDNVRDWRCSVDSKGNRMLVWSGESIYLKSSMLLVNSTSWSAPMEVTRADELIGTGLYGNGDGLIVFVNEQRLCSVTGSSLFNSNNAKKLRKAKA